ncbi:MAG TPA: hypothetical protein VIX59_13355 [Candidatus Binataceae bacterium]
MPAKFRNVHVQTDAREASAQAAAERSCGASLSPHGVTENVARLFLDAVAETLCPTLQASLDAFVEISDDELSHSTLAHVTALVVVVENEVIAAK